MAGGLLMLKILTLATLLIGSAALVVNLMPRAFAQTDAGAGRPAAQKEEKVKKTDTEWREKLTPEQYRVMRCSATEAPFSGKYYDHREDGVYHCAGCGNPLFDSETKYDSGSGWPSYTQPVEGETVSEMKDISHGMVRTEVICSRCEAHLGHVFPDGPGPTGQRYCINSASLDFVGDGGDDQKTGPDSGEDKAAANGD